MKILLVYQNDEYIQVLHLKKEEEAFMTDYESEENCDLTECERIEKILDKRGIKYDMFTPWYMVATDNIPVFNDWGKKMIVLK